MRKKLGFTTAVVLILASWAVIAVTLLPFPPSVDSKLHSVIGRAMAAQTIALFKPGGVIIAIRCDTGEFPQPAAETQFRAFEKEMRRAKIPIATVQKVSLDPLRPLEVAPGDFLTLIRKSPPNTIIV